MLDNYYVRKAYRLRNEALRELGITYNEYLKSEHWQEIKKRTRKKPEYWSKCFVCSSHKNIHLHHVKYHRLGNESLGSHIFPLCGRCHLEVHELAYNSDSLSLKSAMKKLKKMKTN